jgi:adenosine deaminase
VGSLYFYKEKDDNMIASNNNPKNNVPSETELTELHVHVGSSVSSIELWEIAHKQGLRLPTKSFWDFQKVIKMDKAQDYESYLKKFDLTEEIQSSPDAMFKVMQVGIAKAYLRNNITKVELRFNPIYRNKEGTIDLDHIIVFALQGMERAMLKYPVQAGLILCLDRRLGPKENKGIVDKAIKYHRRGVVGIDLAGSITANENSRSFEPKDIAEMVARAREAGLGVTIHTGEVTGPEEMWQVLKYLKPDRIGHGIACIKDEKLMQKLREEEIVLETCPTSNLQTKIIKDYEEMREIYHTLKENKILFTINTDGPEFLGTNLRTEFKKLINNNILSKEDLLKANHIASQASFITYD